MRSGGLRVAVDQLPAHVPHDALESWPTLQHIAHVRTIASGSADAQRELLSAGGLGKFACAIDPTHQQSHPCPCPRARPRAGKLVSFVREHSEYSRRVARRNGVLDAGVHVCR